MSEQHTPAPWEWVGNDLEHRADDWNDVIHTEVSCGAFCYGGTVTLKISEADKRLIAAAPELLNAAVVALAVIAKQYVTKDGLDAAMMLKDAISKATGAA